MRWRQPLTLIPIAAIGGMLSYALWKSRPPRALPIEALTGFQDADAPLLLAADGAPRHGLHRFLAWELAEVPTALRFDSPLGSQHGALSHLSRKFGAAGDAVHLGEDLTGIGGGNSALGDPVDAVADGRVVYAGVPSPEWGNVIVLAHRDREGRLLQSMYGHLEQLEVAVGSVVPRGKKIGSVGTAGGRYPAHLHFEMRVGAGVDITPGESATALNRLDPTAALAELAGAVAEDLSPAALRTALVPGDEPWTTLEIEGAERLGEILNR